MNYVEMMLDVEIWLGFYVLGMVSGVLVFWIEQYSRNRHD